MKEYYFKNKEFVIENFDKKKTFSSFLPGLAGKRGIPLWAFYVNRGQGIASFGLQDKNTQILEFNPAVTAYQSIGTNGFRTFIKIDGIVSELFTENDLKVKRTMRIKRSEFVIEEVNESLGIKYEVVYFGLPNINIAGLVRLVKITNLTNKPMKIELLDGISQLFPYQVENGAFNNIGNLLRSWMEVYSLEDNVGFYKMRSSTSDTAEVVQVQKGNFYISSFEGKCIKPIVDANLIFDYDVTKKIARGFEKNSINEIYEMKQITANKVPVGFSGVNLVLEKGESKRLNTVIGNIHSNEYLLEIAKEICTIEYLDQKRQEAYDIIEDMLEEVYTETNFPIFDDYIKQNYLDNMLRGGYPMILDGKDEKFVYHLYSRKHGDLERDYNFFSLAPEFYSQGNGSFRDVCQNRRNDVTFNPEVGAFNMKMFASFIQADGFNPLSIDGSTFEIEDKSQIKTITDKLFSGNADMFNLLSGKFTPGGIINTLANKKIDVEYSDSELFDSIFKYAKQNFEAHFSEGYWIDHWTYILDLVENYKSIFPDLMHDKLYLDNDYSYFDSPIYVLPRDEKICLTGDSKIRRFGSILHNDDEKVRKLDMNVYASNWLKTNKGEVVKSSLFGKLFVLATNKIASLDPSGIGIEMEAEKPGWNDAMNGLPGLFGSGVSETIELKRVVQFLLDNYDDSIGVQVPSELIKLVDGLINILNEENSDFDYWNKANNYKEEYRKAIRFTTSGSQELNPLVIKKALAAYLSKIDCALDKAYKLTNGIYPTYLVHEVTKYENIMENGEFKTGNYGLKTVRPLEFKVRALPHYLEAPARALKVMNGSGDKARMYEKIRKSNIYDHELSFYKTSEFLDDESYEIGRGRSFTKGWQERESNFLHMTYKYLVGLLKAGMYKEYFEEIKTNLTCFMDPEVYGRSTLENSSFIASSINPDPSVRGQGFVARLSGSTAEMLSLWTLMMMGKTPFVFEGELKLNLKPLLSKEFFADSKVSFMFLGKTLVTYVNELNVDTFNGKFKIKKYVVDGIEMDEVKGEIANKVRNGLVKEIIVFF